MVIKVHEPEIFALLASIHDFLARQSRLEFSTTSADLPEDIAIILSLDNFQGLANETFSEMVYNTCN